MGPAWNPLFALSAPGRYFHRVLPRLPILALLAVAKTGAAALLPVPCLLGSRTDMCQYSCTATRFDMWIVLT